MARVHPAFFATAALLLAVRPAPAQTLWPAPLDTIRVTARRPSARETLPPRSVFASVIPLGADAPAGRDLADLLDRTAGVQVHRYGGLGSFTLVGVRGSTAAQVTVCIDGVPLAAAADGFVDLAQLPVSSFGRAEIYRGPQVASFGGPPSAGVINLVTPAAASLPLKLTAAVGSFATRLARAQWGGSTAGWSALLNAQYRASRGDFRYRDHNGTRFGNSADDRTVKRANNDFEDLALLWKGSWGARAGADRGPVAAGRRLDYTGQYVARDGGVPGTESVQTRSVRLRTERLRHEVAGALPLRTAWPVTLEASAHRETARERFRNREGEVGLGRADTDNRTRESGGRASVALTMPALAQEARASLDLRSERWTPRDRLRGMSDPARTRDHRTVIIQDRLGLGPLSLEAAYRWARAVDNFGTTSTWGAPASPARNPRHEGPTYGARLECGGGLALKGNHGRLARFPTFPELFGQNGLQEGNRSLRPEEGVQWDAGFSWSPRWPLRADAAYFESLTEDRITMVQNSQRTVKAMNLDRAWVRGVESSVFTRFSLSARSSLELQGSYTWQEGRDVGKSPTYHGRSLPNLPEREGYASAALERGAWVGRWETTARSAHYRDRYNSPTRRTAASAIHDFSIERRLLGRQMTARGEVRNLLDRRVEDMDGYPLPGRSFLFSLSWTFDRAGEVRP